MPQTPPFSAMFDSSGYNRNLYQSAEDSCGGLYYHDNNLLSGSLEALIQHLVPNVDYYPDRTYIFTFLLSSRLFMHPYELMAKVCHLCVEHQQLSDPDSDKNQMRKIAPKILQLLTEWTETFPYDFRDERMMRNLKDLAHRIASGEENKSFQQICRQSIASYTWLIQGSAEEHLHHVTQVHYRPSQSRSLGWNPGCPHSAICSVHCFSVGTLGGTLKREVIISE
uniref:RasGEF domain family member 1B n=1 Tax=Callithrix jacchus TaxID=9483 RepID=A0A2R8MJ88_CALJA